MQAVQPPPLILDLRNRSPPASPPSHPADSPSSLASDASSHASDAATSVTSEAPSLGDPLRDQIIAGLKGRAQPVVPGETDVDRQFAYRRTIPTMTLYSQRGLEIYEDITNTQVRLPDGRGDDGNPEADYSRTSARTGVLPLLCRERDPRKVWRRDRLPHVRPAVVRPRARARWRT